MKDLEEMRSLVDAAKKRAINNPEEPFCVLNERGILIDADPALATLLGYELEELLEQPLIEFLHDDDVQTTMQEIASFKFAAEPTLHLENRLRKKDGSHVWIHWTGLGDPETGYAYAVARNITSEKTMKIALEEALASAERANKAKSEFLANMSHEIRTPLNAIIGLTELTLDTELTKSQRELMSTIKASGDHLLALINDILDFSKIEAGAMQLERRAFSLREALESSLDVVKIVARTKGVVLDYQLDPEVPDGIVGDASRLKQVLVNFLGNALKFTNDGQVTLRCWLVKEEPTTIGFEVEDTGIGMSDEQMGKLFTPFHQADASINRKFGGTGLGLSICKQLVHMMGGEIQVTSDLGKGTSFSFDITTKPAIVSTTQFSDPHGYLRGRKVKILTDDPSSKEIIETHVTRWGMIPSDGENDVIISDYKRRQADVKKLAAEGTRLVLVSNNRLFSNETRPELVQELVRPAKLTELHRALLSLLGRKQQDNYESEFTENFAKEFPLNILVAEDNLVNQKVIQSMLAKLGYTPTLASDGEEAVQLAKEHRFDLILMDVQMPVMDGMQATKLIRKQVENQPRIVAATAHADTRVQEECMAAGMDDFLMKPIRLSALAEALSNNAQLQVESHAEFIDLVRWNEMADLLGGAMEEMVNTFETDTRQTLAKFSEAPRENAHKIKGAAWTLGFQALGDAAKDLESDLVPFEEGFTKLCAAFEEVVVWARAKIA